MSDVKHMNASHIQTRHGSKRKREGVGEEERGRGRNGQEEGKRE